MAEVFVISSAKGGVGKTTVAVNLGAALAERDKKVTIIDGSIATPDVSLHLGIPFYAHTLNDFEKDADINKVVFRHDSGLNVMPTSIHLVDSLKEIDISKIGAVVEALKNEENHFIIIDSSGGLTSNTTDVMRFADKAIIVTNPELAAVVNSHKTIISARNSGIGVLGVIVNRAKRFKNEMNEEEIRHILGSDIEIIGKIAEHRSVPMATMRSVPVVSAFPASPATREFRKIAATICGEEYREKRILQRFLDYLSNTLRPPKAEPSKSGPKKDELVQPLDRDSLLVHPSSMPAPSSFTS